MSDEPEARMWDDGEPRYESRNQGVFFESAFASSEHLDRAPLLAEDTYTDVPVNSTLELAELTEHCHWKSASEPKSAQAQLLTALVLCGFFMICELIGGYLAGSVSVMSDAAHMLSDCGGFALALLALRCAQRSPDVRMSYGYRRAEVLGAMASVLLIWVLTGVFVYVAAVRLYSGEYGIKADVMMAVAGAGVGFNIVLALVLHGCASDIAHHHTHGGMACDHTHTHTHSHGSERNGTTPWSRTNGNADYSMKELTAVEAEVAASTPRNINLRAALIHVIGDLIQSCGVLLASVIIKFYPSAQFVDPICTFVFSFLVLLTSARVVRDALTMLMQAVPQGFRYKELVSSLAAVRGVRHVHSVHVWALSTHHLVLSAHIATDDLSDPEVVLHACQQLARVQFSVQAATFQLERFSPSMLQCGECRQPALAP